MKPWQGCIRCAQGKPARRSLTISNPMDTDTERELDPARRKSLEDGQYASQIHRWDRAGRRLTERKRAEVLAELELSRLAPARPPRPEPVDLSGGTWLPPNSRRRQAETTVRLLCPAENAAPAQPAGVGETAAERRARQAAQAAAGWT